MRLELVWDAKAAAAASIAAAKTAGAASIAAAATSSSSRVSRGRGRGAVAVPVQAPLPSSSRGSTSRGSGAAEKRKRSKSTFPQDLTEDPLETVSTNIFQIDAASSKCNNLFPTKMDNMKMAEYDREIEEEMEEIDFYLQIKDEIDELEEDEDELDSNIDESDIENVKVDELEVEVDQLGNGSEDGDYDDENFEEEDDADQAEFPHDPRNIDYLKTVAKKFRQSSCKGEKARNEMREQAQILLNAVDKKFASMSIVRKPTLTLNRPVAQTNVQPTRSYKVKKHSPFSIYLYFN